jgi:hypothetical protein
MIECAVPVLFVACALHVRLRLRKSASRPALAETANALFQPSFNP